MPDRDFCAKDGRWYMTMYEFEDALVKQDLSGAEWRVLSTIRRFAWGDHENHAELRWKFLLDHTGMGKSSISDAITRLEERNIITIKNSPENRTKRYRIYRINSKTSTWKTVRKTGRFGKPDKVVRKTEPPPIKKKTIKDNLYYPDSLIVLDALNEISGKRFRYSKESLEPICARLADSFTVEDCLRVLENKWLDADLKVQYYRPQTLFRKSYFEGYLNMSGAKRKPTNDKQAAKLAKWQRRYRERYAETEAN